MAQSSPSTLSLGTTCGSTGLRVIGDRPPNRKAGARPTTAARDPHLAGWARLPQRQSEGDGGRRSRARSWRSSRASAPRVIVSALGSHDEGVVDLRSAPERRGCDSRTIGRALADGRAREPEPLPRRTAESAAAELTAALSSGRRLVGSLPRCWCAQKLNRSVSSASPVRLRWLFGLPPGRPGRLDRRPRDSGRRYAVRVRFRTTVATATARTRPAP